MRERRPRWWFGGLAATIVACVVAPLDLVKSHMQTQRKKKSILFTALKVIRLRGYLGFYDGFSAAAFRQMTCTSIRFSIYEAGKYHEILNENFLQKIALASFAGVMGAAIGIPPDVINVRMQNDMKFSNRERRNYKHVFDALVRIPKEEGFFSLYTGASAAFLKSAVGTIGQIAVYDQIKTMLVFYFKKEDDFRLHFQSSFLSSIISSVISQPFDVLKTLMMNARPGEFKTPNHIFVHMMRFGPLGIFRGLLPNLARKGPATILLFLIYEQLRINLGYIDP
ncbi:mitochondrial dicarboxylate carrier [Scaptodrosophila lebanonensis]|uniref:Mitochondrial dicarboxylate carrier n=1 Tax=Drosophila lebanonensis TaxID=7225 RepID=A0A6J2UGV6_DROLE|nr:mitochondrial dicarboxylate carrier [Scaptodrosophila lebanonensis]